MWIPADRLLAIVDLEPDHNVQLHTAAVKRLADIRAGRQKFVGFEAADRILTRLNLDLYWHIPKEDGGLADIYEDGAQYGKPEGLSQPKPWKAKYKTEAERLEARRETWRRSYQRKMGRLAA